MQRLLLMERLGCRSQHPVPKTYGSLLPDPGSVWPSVSQDLNHTCQITLLNWAAIKPEYPRYSTHE
jgi:hypothetical protein